VGLHTTIIPILFGIGYLCVIGWFSLISFWLFRFRSINRSIPDDQFTDNQ
jgi:hypothetical protein